jgi:transketolase
MGQTAAMSVAENVIDRPARVAPFGHALVSAASRNDKIVGLTADLGKYTDIDPFQLAYPKRFFNIGMAEQNMIGIAAGMARVGFIPFCTTYCVFATRRAYDFIAIGCALGDANVKIIAGLPGLTTGYGATHQGNEDLALMRAIPNLVVIDPCDATEIEQATHAIAEHPGSVYMRLRRGTVPVVLDPDTYQFRIGVGHRLRSGSHVGIISTGLMTERALQAVDQLQQEGIDCSLLHMPTIKPFDESALLELAGEVDTLITAENHVVQGGLASIVADLLVANGCRNRLFKIGLPDLFIECGSLPYLNDKYGLTAERIMSVAREAVDSNGK